MAKTVAKPVETGLVLKDDASADLLSEGQEFGKDDLQVPFLKLIQKLSPQMKRTHAKYDENAKEGQIVETVLGNLFPSSDEDDEEGILVIPCAYERQYAEWLPERGSLIQIYGTDASILENCGKDAKGGYIRKDNMNEISETAFYYVLFFSPTLGFWDTAVIPMGGSQWKTARNWNSRIRKLRVSRSDGSVIQNPAPFSGVYRFKAGMESDDQNEWMGWRVSFEEFTLNREDGVDLINQAASFRNMSQEGKVQTPDLDEDQQGDVDDGSDHPF